MFTSTVLAGPLASAPKARPLRSPARTISTRSTPFKNTSATSYLPSSPTMRSTPKSDLGNAGPIARTAAGPGLRIPGPARLRVETARPSLAEEEIDESANQVVVGAKAARANRRADLVRASAPDESYGIWVARGSGWASLFTLNPSRPCHRLPRPSVGASSSDQSGSSGPSVEGSHHTISRGAARKSTVATGIRPFSSTICSSPLVKPAAT